MHSIHTLVMTFSAWVAKVREPIKSSNIVVVLQHCRPDVPSTMPRSWPAPKAAVASPSLCRTRSSAVRGLGGPRSLFTRRPSQSLPKIGRVGRMLVGRKDCTNHTKLCIIVIGRFGVFVLL